MPPRSSRAASPLSRSEHRSDSSSSYLTALRPLENPVSSDVLHIADTLTTSAEDEIIAENLRFLRSPVGDPQEEWRAENAREEHARERQRTVLEHRAEDRERRERLERAISRLRRQEHPAAYGDRTPSANILYDWAPPSDGDELSQLLNELRQQQPNINPEILRNLGRSQLESERQSQNRGYHSSRLSTLAHSSHSSESSLRATAITQSVRRHPRFRDQSRLFMQRSLADRESAQRAGNSEAAELRELRDRFSPRNSGVSVREPSRYEQNRRSWLAEQQTSSGEQTSTNNRPRMTGRDVRARIDSYRRSYLENPTPSTSTPSSSPSLEQTIEYISRLRSCICYEDSLRTCKELGFLTKRFFGDNHEDMLINLANIPPPAETSWLRPGAVLSGSQHATSIAAAVGHVTSSSQSSAPHRSQHPPSASPYYTPTSPWPSRDTYIPPHARRASDTLPPPPPIAPPPPSNQDRWPVKVTIHAVDYTNLTLSATMEAYNVPSQSPSLLGILNAASQPLDVETLHAATRQGTRTSSITTYLEGEMLDFRTHGWLTESFESDARNDAMYWRKLLPFAGVDEAELVSRWTSMRAMRRVCEEFVFMRWKERCFVRGTGRSEYVAADGTTHPTDASAAASSGPQTSTFSAWPQAQAEGPASPGGTSVSGPSGATSHIWHDNEYAAEDSCGLTISGFYYVCLRRSDGAVEGLYHDPQSSPYQHLRLGSVGGGVWPKYEFR